MKRWIAGGIIISTFLISFSTWSSSAQQCTSVCLSDQLPDMVERISPGVVNISSTTVVNYRVHGMEDFMRFWGIPQERKQTSLGSGFIIDQEGFIITNNHVVEHAAEVMVTLSDQRQFK